MDHSRVDTSTVAIQNSQNDLRSKDIRTDINKDEYEDSKRNLVIVGKTNRAKTEPKRYQFYVGNSKICCRGKIFTGPRPIAILFTFLAIHTPIVIFYSFTIPKLNKELVQILILIITVIINIFINIFMFATCMTNPGILPKLEADLNLISNISRSRPLGQKYIQNINGDQCKVVFCNVCFIIRPPRTYHCYYCDNCVERFDHHCPWISCCVGKRNYIFFIIFITLLSCKIFFTSAISLKVWIDSSSKPLAAFTSSIPEAIIILINFIIGCFVCTLTVYHYYIIIIGQTTHENLKNTNAKGASFENIANQLCIKRGEDRMQEKLEFKWIKRSTFPGREAIELIHCRNQNSMSAQWSSDDRSMLKKKEEEKGCIGNTGTSFEKMERRREFDDMSDVKEDSKREEKYISNPY